MVNSKDNLLVKEVSTNKEVHVDDDTVGKAYDQDDNQLDSNQNYNLDLDYDVGNHDYNVFVHENGTVKTMDYISNGKVTVDDAYKRMAPYKTNYSTYPDIFDNFYHNEPFHTVFEQETDF